MQWQEFRTHIRHVTAGDLKRIERAFALGMKLHEHQQRKSGDPYFIHPIAVALMLSELGADADTLIAALLHDTVEDTPLTIPEVERQFSGSVASLIDGVTKLSADDFSMFPDLNEQIETLRKMFTLMQKDIRIMLIKLTDRLHNMQTAEYLAQERQKLIAEETQEVYVKIADKLSMRDLRDELEALCLSILEPEMLAKLSELRTKNEERGHSIIDDIRHSIRRHNPQLSAHVQIFFEHKSWRRLRSQLGIGTTAVTGLAAMTAAIVCDDVEQAYQTLGVLHQHWKTEALSVHDFINAPHLNGYRGLHTTIIAPDGMRIRCKIRTREMHEYAHRGVATVCFNETSDVHALLPWTAKITPLSSDTAGSSEDFWQSLKSDILGETITIHGPDDTTVQLPRGSTVLDGAFHLFQERTLCIQSILLNGINVPFNTILETGASLDVTIGTTPSFERTWLHHVKTRLAAGYIRAALTSLPEKEKIEQGRALLQREFSEHRKGFIDEFNMGVLTERFRTLGRTFASVDSILSAIAESNLDPGYVYELLFPSKKSASDDRRRPRSVVFDIDLSDLPLMERINAIYSRFAVPLNEIRTVIPQETAEGTVHINVLLTDDQLTALMRELSEAGIGGIKLEVPLRRYGLLIFLLLLLWGLDPIFAHALLHSALSPTSLTVIRFSTFAFAGGTMYYLYLLRSPLRSLSHLPIRPSLIFAGLSLFATGILSYLTLEAHSASAYMLFIIAGILAGNLIDDVQQSFNKLKILTISVAFISAFFAAIALDDFSLIGILVAYGSGIGFAAYSRLSRRYQEVDTHIQARYPIFVFLLSCIALIPTIFLLPFALSDLTSLPATTLIAAALFALVFCFLPYVLFFQCMQKFDSSFLNRLLPFACIGTFLAEFLLNRSIPLVSIIPLTTLLLSIYILEHAQRKVTACSQQGVAQ
jgi:RelA/SpoT family (p)ppGpp synthetase